MKNYLIELTSLDLEQVDSMIRQLREMGFAHDETYSPKKLRIPYQPRGKGKTAPGETVNYLIRGQLEESQLPRFEALDFVVKCWVDSEVFPFGCKCNEGRKKTLEKVAACVGANELWDKGFRGQGIAIGIVDGGVDRSVIPEVVDGHRPDWGTISDWDSHGNMTATDALGIAPDADIFDLRLTPYINNPALISNAIDAYDWAIDQFLTTGRPQILSNSWGIYQESWDPVYATDISHPFTRMVEDALNQGIAVLFAAGNCGETCPSGVRLGTKDQFGRLNGRCNTDTGGGRDIWGANGHPGVMTIASVNYNWKRIKSSSQGPAALDARKPDFCGYSNFKGYKMKDEGTSAACPIVAGAAALLLNVDNTLSPNQIKNLFSQTAIDIQDVGWDTNTGHGIIRVNRAYYELRPEELPPQGFKDQVCTYSYELERRCTNWATTQTRQCIETRAERTRRCRQTREERTRRCTRTREERRRNCCTWRPCSWFCRVWTWVVSVVCIAWAWFTETVCIAWEWVVSLVCIAWTWIVTRFCKAWAWFVKVVTFSNCKCRTTYVNTNPELV